MKLPPPPPNPTQDTQQDSIIETQQEELSEPCKITPQKISFKPPKQKSQISLVFGMNALVPLGTIKTLSKTNLDFLYTP